jgi:hypothetical protein
MEFLSHETVWRDMLTLTNDLAFDPDIALLNSCVHDVKIGQVWTTANLES